MLSEQNDSGSGSGGRPSQVHTPLRREKKRVGFHSSKESSGESSDSTTHQQQTRQQRQDEGVFSPAGSPKLAPGELPPNAPDAYELSLALTKILSAEQEKKRQVQNLAPDTPDVGPKRPRPALRRNTSYDDPNEREKADQAESRTTERQYRSMADARQRADRLAVSVGSYSAPGSRRGSLDLEEVPSFKPLIEDYDNPKGSPPAGSNTIEDAGYFGLRQRIANSDRFQHHAAAENLVRSHTRKGKRDLFTQHPNGGPASGTATPVLQQAYAHDYVPRPDQYRGGILSSLLKLYHDDRTPGSGMNTPKDTGTPLMSPRNSPPISRPGSSNGTPPIRSPPRSRPTSGLFNYHKNRHSTSSLALTELMKSSSMFAAPASANISDKWAEKIKQQPPPPKKRDKARITIHIAGIIQRHRYLLKLCRALMMYGAPTHRLEEYMTMSSRVLEIEAQFLYLPGCMIISFDDSTTHTTEVKLVRVPQGIDLGRLRDVHNIYKEVVHDKIGVEEATKRLDDVNARKDKYNVWIRVFLYGVASACVAPFAFQGRFIDLPIAFFLGCIVGILQLVLAPSNELYAHVFEVSAALITSFFARAFGSIQNGKLFCFSALAQSSIALILPGYMVLCSSLELQSHNLVAGSVRMVHALIYTLFLGYGITIGASLYGMIDSNATSRSTCDNPLGREWYFLFVPGFTMCLCLINQAKWKQTPVMVGMALAGWSVNSYCAEYFGGNGQISNMLGALTIGILANLYSRMGRHVENGYLDFVDWWKLRVRPRYTKKRIDSDSWSLPTLNDPESRPGTPEKHQEPEKKPRKVGYSLAAAAMLPAIFVQVPSGLAAGGSLLASITMADEITKNGTKVASDMNTMGNLEGTAFNVLFKVIQVAIGISVGLFMSALIVYPLGWLITADIQKQQGKLLGVIVFFVILELGLKRLAQSKRWVSFLQSYTDKQNYRYGTLLEHNTNSSLKLAKPSSLHQPTAKTAGMKIRSSRISGSIAKAISQRHGKSKKGIIKTIIAFFRLFRLLLTRYRSIDFLALRKEVWQLDEDEYHESFQTDGEDNAELIPIGDLGYSGSTFFTTANEKYLIKSLPRRFEHDFFVKELLDPYVGHMKFQPHSLLVRITDLVVSSQASIGGMIGAAPTHHIVMENLLYGKPKGDEGKKWETYDLKPNDYFFPERDIADGALVPDSVIERLIDEFPDKVRVTHEAKQELISLLFADSALLASHNAVDYSLFLVRYPQGMEVPVVESDAGRWRRGVDDVDGKWTYRCVVLDFFWAKHAFQARALTKIVKIFNKVAHKGPMSITADPEEYRERFMKMVDEMVVEG
ncbi:pheromone-regulated membrane protein [Fusarium oxysporum f. sp. phaseoli]